MTAPSWLDQLAAAEARGACGSAGISRWDCGCEYCWPHPHLDVTGLSAGVLDQLAARAAAPTPALCAAIERAQARHLEAR